MSTWRVAVKAVHELGGEATTLQVADATICYPWPGLRSAERYGLIRRISDFGHGINETRWAITARGIAFAEGRLHAWRHGPYGMRWQATWLASLPRDIRINGSTTA